MNSPESPPKNESRRSYRIVWLLLTTGIATGLCYGIFLLYLNYSVPGMVRRAAVELAGNRPTQARNTLAWVIWVQPGNADALLLLGRCLVAEEQFASAVSILDQIDTNSPNSKVAGGTAAMAELARGAVEAAETRLVTHLQRFPDDHPMRTELRWLYFNQLRKRDVEVLLEQQLVDFPDQLQAAEDLISSEFRCQLPRDGKPYLEQVDQKVPGQGTVKLALATCQWQLGKPEEARQLFLEALRLRPDLDWMKQSFALFLLEQGSTPDEIRKYVTPSPKDDIDWYLLSELSDREGELPLALSHIREALKIRPREPRYVTRLSELLQRTGQTVQAEVARKLARELGEINSRLNELVLSDAHLRPDVAMCRTLADLNSRRGREVQAQAWNRRAEVIGSIRRR